MIAARAASKRVLDELHITSAEDLAHLDEIAWARGALVEIGKLDGAEARLVRTKNDAVITLSSSVQYLPRRRFSIAHELGHLEMHSERQSIWKCGENQIGEPNGNTKLSNEEIEANQFASLFLLPKHILEPLCKRQPPSLALIKNLADQFCTSLTATATRYMDVCNDICTVVITQGTTIHRFIPSKDFKSHYLFVKVKEELDPYSYASDLMKNNKLESGQKSIEVSCWIKDGRHDGDAMLMEDSIRIPNLDQTITLLWVNKDIWD